MEGNNLVFDSNPMVLLSFSVIESMSFFHMIVCNR